MAQNAAEHQAEHSHQKIWHLPANKRLWLLLALLALTGVLKLVELSLINHGYNWGLLEGMSMYPRVKDLDFIASAPEGSVEIKRGDLVRFDFDNDELVKEVLAVSGDKVRMENSDSRPPETVIMVNETKVRTQSFVWFSVHGLTMGENVAVPQGKILLIPVNKVAGEKRVYWIERRQAKKIIAHFSILPEGVVDWWRQRQGTSAEYLKYAKGDESE